MTKLICDPQIVTKLIKVNGERFDHVDSSSTVGCLPYDSTFHTYHFALKNLIATITIIVQDTVSEKNAGHET